MATTTKPNSKKRKHREVTGKTVMARAVFENEVASEWFFVQADQVPKLFNMLMSIDKEIHFIEGNCNSVKNIPSTFRGKKIWPPFMLLQETSTRKHGLAHTRYIVLDVTKTRNYVSWYERNVEHGTEDGLRVEFHIYLKDDVPSAKAQVVAKFKEECSDAGQELTALSDYPLRQVLLEDIRKPLQEWYPGLCAPTSPTDIVPAPMTKEVFLQRHIADPMRFIRNCPLCVMDAHEKGLQVFGRRFLRKMKEQARRETELAAQADSLLESATDDNNEADNMVDKADAMEVDGFEVDGDDNATFHGDGFEERGKHN